MALTRVDTGIQNFPDFSKNQQLAGAQIYIGIADLDPEILANQVQAYVVQEDGTQVAVPQPISTSAGGIPTYQGSPVQIAVAETSYSVKILNSLGSQIYYQPNNTDLALIDAAQVSYAPQGTGAEVATVDERLNRMEVNVFDFFTDAEKADVKNRTSELPVSAKVQAAIDSLPVTGGVIIMPKGRYLWDAPVETRDLVVVKGEGDATEILVSTDIEVFNSNTTTVSTAIFQAEFCDLFINKTVTGATTSYDIHLQNPNICQFHNVHIKSGHIDSAYSATNVGGIWLDKPAASTSSAFMNRVINCWIQNNSIYFRNLTDSVVSGGFVWGHVREFAIRINGGGACAVENVVGLIASKFKGGIWIDGSAVNQIRIHGNEFDGNPLLDTGTGVYCPQSSITVTVTNNTFWGCDFHGIETVDPIGWTITGNNFWKNNSADNFYDDIRITGKAFQPNGNVVTGNTHVIDELRNNKGYAIREFNDGFNPVSNTYSGNGALGSTGYAQPAILVLQNASQVGNTGLGAQNSLRILDDSIRVDNEATVVKNNRVEVANGATLDLTITAEDYFGNPGSYVGTLMVSTTRSNFASQSRRQVLAVAGYGTTLTSTLQHNQDGSGGGATFTLTAPSNGVIRFTNTSGNACTVDMMFVGTKGLA